jgi:2-succinyl-5-enolpyruvyl-6-hydroxy-3-cyclohexene-1-carboxylate synthase
LAVDPGRALATLRGPAAPDTAWLERWRSADAAVAEVLTDALGEELSEPLVARILGQWLGAEDTLFVASSMPIRDIEGFMAAREDPPRVLSSRGANGIDGTVSSAYGAAAAGGGRVVLLIGDVALAHDIGGLLAARRTDLQLTLVLLNNDGGGIFSFLPQAGVDGFEQLFGTPHGLDFRPFVKGYGGSFARVRDWVGFREAITHALGRGGLRVVEISTGRERNVRLHRAIWRRVDRTVQDALAAAAA